jgi:hypothetical protein
VPTSDRISTAWLIAWSPYDLLSKGRIWLGYSVQFTLSATRLSAKLLISCQKSAPRVEDWFNGVRFSRVWLAQGGGASIDDAVADDFNPGNMEISWVGFLLNFISLPTGWCHFLETNKIISAMWTGRSNFSKKPTHEISMLPGLKSSATAPVHIAEMILFVSRKWHQPVGSDMKWDGFISAI